MKFPTEVVLSLATGNLLCSFGLMHELAEFLVGEPVFTHQFAHKGFNGELREEIFSQHPQLRGVDSSGVTTSNWQAFRDEQLAVFGPLLEIEQGHRFRSMRESFVEPLKGKKVIAVESI